MSQASIPILQNITDEHYTHKIILEFEMDENNAIFCNGRVLKLLSSGLLVQSRERGVRVYTQHRGHLNMVRGEHSKIFIFNIIEV